ncbi:hypothetical protein W97_01907 [Coniosporium apollinis CBS 100218]|uniref:BTB domain-containing protein n=1 Tax=Coniosporium apollinis (strain CBS 100218) TaxID=1168221 RepID=R7YLD2_CONA1|nr:uncharacterized protein W97_01907 [Coniosporium apollinis CBS 100218]EON62683.1 hypothetical protein W97_01907 [Coniosporium apollinis CBS 100218]
MNNYKSADAQYREGTLGREIFPLMAGPSPHRKCYHVHKDLLCWYSPYFKKTLRGSFREAKALKLILRDTEVAVLGVVVDWLYTQSLPEHDDPRIQACIGRWNEPITGVYIFSDRYDIPDLREHAMDDFYTYFTNDDGEDMPRYSVINTAFNNLPRSASLCRFCIDVYARYWSQDQDDEGEVTARADLPKDFLAGLMIESAEVMKHLVKTGSKPALPERCHYQE